eukprot:jgi/Hompol1/6862/HPOL_003698-RA
MVEVEMERILDAAQIPIVVHGTYRKNLESILATGLRSMGRQHMHFAVGLAGDSGVISGMRASCDVFIYIDAARAMADGIQFLRSANNVILSEGRDGVLDPKYFARIVDRAGRVLGRAL